jgi:hypothetical protein
LPGLRGDIARGGMQPVLAKLRQRGGNKLAFGLFTFGCCGVVFMAALKINQSID